MGYLGQAGVAFCPYANILVSHPIDYHICHDVGFGLRVGDHRLPIRLVDLDIQGDDGVTKQFRCILSQIGGGRTGSQGRALKQDCAYQNNYSSNQHKFVGDLILNHSESLF